MKSGAVTGRSDSAGLLAEPGPVPLAVLVMGTILFCGMLSRPTEPPQESSRHDGPRKHGTQATRGHHEASTVLYPRGPDLQKGNHRCRRSRYRTSARPIREVWKPFATFRFGYVTNRSWPCWVRRVAGRRRRFGSSP